MIMKALLDFDEKEFWIQLFSIVARRGEGTADEDIGLDSASESLPSREGRVRDSGEPVERCLACEAEKGSPPRRKIRFRH
jgi:hypothetical protein